MRNDFMILPLTIKSIKDDDPEYFYVEGIASPYGNIDLGGDKVIPGAFSSDIRAKGNERPILWQHDMKNPVGLGLFSDSIKNLTFLAKLPKADDFVMKRVIPQLKVRSVTGCSIGYEAVKWEYNTSDHSRELKEIKLYETSFVTVPMNPDAQILSLSKCMKQIEMKGYNQEFKNYMNELVGILNIDSKTVPSFQDYPLMDEGTAWDKGKAIDQIKAATKSSDGPSGDYRNGFMYFDSENSDNFTAYKLPYVYYDKGFKVVPKALYAIAAALSGARGGVDIPDADKEKIKSQLNKYYKKLGKESPFKSNGKCFVDVNTFKSIDKNEAFKIFDSDIELSQKVKQMIVDGFSGCLESGCGSNSQNIESFSELMKSMKELSDHIKL